MTENEFLTELYIYANKIGSQELWNILYPYMKQKDYQPSIYKEVIKRFSLQIALNELVEKND